MGATGVYARVGHFTLAFIRPVLYLSCPAPVLYCIGPVLTVSCTRTVLHLTCPMHPYCTAPDLSYTRTVLHLTCPAPVLYCTASDLSWLPPVVTCFPKNPSFIACLPPPISTPPYLLSGLSSSFPASLPPSYPAC